MTVTGIIVEYNPLHNGHIYHIKKTKEKTNCDYIVAVMSGNFVQRGEPAIINKWSRTKAAILSGVDLVLELPFLYSTSSAENFAYGAVSILNSIGVTDNICFGSETDDIHVLKQLQNMISSSDFNNIFHKNIKTGISYPKAMQKTLTDYIIAKNSQSVNVFNYNFSPNDILSIEYINSLKKLSSDIIPYTIKRIANNYNDENMSGKYSSANSIRKNINSKNIYYTMPEYSYKILNDDIRNGKGPITIEDYRDLIFYNLRMNNIDYFKNLPEVSEGLEYKIKSMSQTYSTVDNLIKNIKSKRYTYSRIQRILLYSVLGISKEYYSIIKNGPEYIRVLGFNDNGRKLLKKIKNNCSIPVITNPCPKDYELLKYDILSTDIYVLGYKNDKFKMCRQDFIIPPVYIKQTD